MKSIILGPMGPKSPLFSGESSNRSIRGRKARNRVALSGVVGASLLVFGCGLDRTERKSERSVPTEYVEGSFVVQATADLTEQALATNSTNVAQSLGCAANAPERVNWQSGGGVLTEELANTWNVKFSGCDFSPGGTAQIVAALGAGENVVTVEAESIASVGPVTENDRLKSQATFLPYIRRDAACSLIDRENQKVIKVAVIDTGIDIDHPDLRDAMLRDERGEIVGANFVGSGATLPPDSGFRDGTGHGTHVAGLIAATANNREGAVGVASCVNVKIIPVRVLGDNGRGSSVEIERGVKWAADQGADIINLSLGSVSIVGSRRELTRSVYEYAASRDIVVFAAAGNSSIVHGSQQDGGFVYGFPSSYANVISVAASGETGSLTGFSNRGNLVDIAAPGSRVLSTYTDDSYARLSGTSMASPVAAGAYALALAAVRKDLPLSGRIPAASAAELMSRAVLSDAEISESDVASGGIIDSERLVKLAKERYPARTAPPVSPPSTPVAPSEQMPAPTPTPERVSFGFEGLVDGQRPGFPQKIVLQGIPAGATQVYLFWGNSYESFARVRILAAGPGSAGKLEVPSRWYLYGTQKLWAYAINAEGRLVGLTSVQLRGF